MLMCKRQKESLVRNFICFLMNERIREAETDLVDSTKQRHELAEQSGAQAGDVHEGTLAEEKRRT